MDISQLHLNVIEEARGIPGDDGQRQAAMIAHLNSWLANFNEFLGSDLELTRGPDADEFVERNINECGGLVIDLIRSIQTMDQAIGHDRIHLAYDLYEGLRALSEEPLPLCEQFIVLLGVVGHDIGRYAEEKVFGKPMATQVHAWFSAHLIDALFDELVSSSYGYDELVWRAIRNRAVGCVVAHFGGNDTTDPLRHFVQSIDRLAGIFGIRDFARNLACDMHLRGARFWPDPKLSCAWEMAPFNNLPPEQFEGAASIKASWTNVVHYLEVPMRTAYPLATERLEARATEMKIQAARLLMHLGGGIRSDPELMWERGVTLAHQIFAPELVACAGVPIERFGPPPKTDDLTRWDKRRRELPRSVWDAVWIESARTESDYPYMPSDLEMSVCGLIDLFDPDSEVEYHPRKLMSVFLEAHAYTLSSDLRDALVSRIIAETTAAFPDDGDVMLAFGFAFALAESYDRSAEELEIVHRIRDNANMPLLSAVASAIADEPVFHIHGQFETP